MKFVHITEKVYFKMILSPSVFARETEMLNGHRYLTGPKDPLIRRICNYNVDGGSITFIGVDYTQIDQLISILNA